MTLLTEKQIIDKLTVKLNQSDYISIDGGLYSVPNRVENKEIYVIDEIDNDNIYPLNTLIHKSLKFYKLKEF